jgi:hypothetical protein
MASRPTASIISFFASTKKSRTLPVTSQSRSPERTEESEGQGEDSQQRYNDQPDYGEGNDYLFEGKNEVDNEIIDEYEDEQDIPRETIKRKGVPAFQGEAIMKKKTTRIGNFLLTSSEETKLPAMSVRSRPREEKVLTGNVRSVIATEANKSEIYLRINDKVNMGHLITKNVQGLIRLWCKVCSKPVNPNKTNTAAHMASTMHKNNVKDVGEKLNEEQLLASCLISWRKGNPDKEGRTLTECVDLFRMETVRMLMLVGVEISKVISLNICF